MTKIMMEALGKVRLKTRMKVMIIRKAEDKGIIEGEKDGHGENYFERMVN